MQALSSRAEAARRGAPVVTISSGKGGVGKTTLSVNLVVAFAPTRRTLLIDADLGMANADIFCGLSPVRRLGSARVEDLIVEAPGGFQLVPGAVGRHHPDGDGVVRALELVNTHDLVLVDTSPGVGRDVRRLIRTSDLAVVVVTPEPTSIADAYALIKCLHGEGEA
ncbi:MAG: AAA family ATPase, partial [Phycisphaerales bacterium]|nr:AAA family ATPase [Phycisphaerales bacterium]